jgi:16S rRNA (guanine(1405)-N(7))-methyltransferase
MAPNDQPDIDAIVEQLGQSKKYREVGICDDTIRDIVITELARQKNPKEAVQAARKKLHEVVALYLGDPDYAADTRRLEAVFATGDEAAIQAFLIEIMRIHDSTRERLALLDTFYAQVFGVTGVPQTILDIACGLNPLSIPWMGLPAGAKFYAYEIHQQRVDFLNRYLALQGVGGGAFNQDILVHPPREAGDVALLLKETHRMEKRRHGIVLPLLDALAVRWIVLSSPVRSRTGRHAVKDIYREQIHGIIADRPWTITEIEFENELVYCLDKSPQSV